MGRLVWGFSARAMYASLRRLAALEPGSTVLDAACGSGLALRHLQPGAGHRYVGVDASPAMIERTRRSVQRRGFERAELHLADIERIPLADAAADVGLPLARELTLITADERQAKLPLVRTTRLA